jgi:hypothetical protein
VDTYYNLEVAGPTASSARWWRGWIITFSSMVLVFSKYAFLWEKQRANSSGHSA